MTDMQKITDLLTDVAMSTSFTPAALDKFKEALDKTAKIEKELQGKSELAEERYAEILRLKNRVRELEEREKELDTRSRLVLEREVKMTELERRVAVAEAKEGVRKEVFETIFRLPTVRRNFTDQVSGSGYANGQSSNNTETHTVSESTTEE